MRRQERPGRDFAGSDELRHLEDGHRRTSIARLEIRVRERGVRRTQVDANAVAQGRHVPLAGVSPSPRTENSSFHALPACA